MLGFGRGNPIQDGRKQDILSRMTAGPKTANLNLKVTEDERWAFKELCVKHRLSQVAAFRRAVRLLKDDLKTKAPTGPDPSRAVDVFAGSLKTR